MAIGGLAIAGLSVPACAPRAAAVFPTGAMTPTPEAAAIWQATTAACRTAANYSAEIVLDGRVGAEKLRRVTLQGQMTRDGRIRLIAVSPVGMGGPVFVLAGRADRATLTLPRDRRVLVAPVADIVEALIGVRFAPEDWVDVLTACVAAAPNVTAGALGRDIVVTLGDGRRALLKRDGAAWHVALGERAEAFVEYRAYLGRWPSLARLTSAASAAVPINLGLTINQVFVNSQVQDRAFLADVPADFLPMTLAELRAIGPLGDPR